MKKLLALIAAFMAIPLFLYVLVSMDQQARHPGLQEVELPPLISVRDFYGSQDTGRNFGMLTKRIDISWPLAAEPGAGISAQLLLPQTRPDPGPLPTVVMIESGSPGEDNWENERDKQFLANRGYAVLSIDCREMAGFERSIIGADLKPYGQCTENQLTDLARWLVTKGTADPKAMAIIGSGVGGHAVLMMMSEDPDLFKAAIVHSAITALASPQAQIPCGTHPKPDDKESCLTAPEADREAEIVAVRSPINHVDTIQGSIMITHGRADKSVNFEQVRAYSRALTKAKKDHEMTYFDHDGHGYSRWQTRVHIARLTERFLADQLGGRNGRYDYIQLIAKLF